MKRIALIALAVIGALALFLALTREDQVPRSGVVMEASVLAFDNAMQPVLPLPELTVPSAERAELGRLLFHDTRLSEDGSLSCASCHALAAGGVDGRPSSIGIGGAIGPINAPTVLNSGLSFVQFWDGRAATLEEQAAGPVHNPIEMGSSWAQVIARLSQDEHLRRTFARLYPAGMTGASIADAIAAFERTLLTVDAPFDRYLRGDRQALSAQAQEGYQRFREFGCISCHQGRLLGGNMFQKFGVMGDYFAGRPPTKVDLGRYNVTGRDEDKHVFKVPSLRNVALTAPYFHDASAPTLEQAVHVMGRYQLGRELSDDDVRAIVAFLNSLTGQQPTARPAS